MVDCFIIMLMILLNAVFIEERWIHSQVARNSVKIGIVMLAAWVIPLIGIMLAVTGLVTGIASIPSSRRDLVRAGIFLNSLGLGLSLLNLTVSIYFLLYGDIDLNLLLEQLY